MDDMPVLFNTLMIKAILEGRKTNTRRPLKQPFEIHPNGNITKPRGNERLCPYEPPYKPGDTLYVRETWQSIKFRKPTIAVPIDYTPIQHIYKADSDIANSDGTDFKWHPSIHMPRKAARLFLKVKGVHVERLQDITEDGAKAEGIRGYTKDGNLFKYCVDLDNWINNFKPSKEYSQTAWQAMPRTAKEAFELLWDSIYAAPAPVKEHGIITHYESYPWEDTQEVREYKGLPWYVYGNPWVWSIEFERKV